MSLREMVSSFKGGNKVKSPEVKKLSDKDLVEKSGDTLKRVENIIVIAEKMSEADVFDYESMDELIKYQKEGFKNREIEDAKNKLKNTYTQKFQQKFENDPGFESFQRFMVQFDKMENEYGFDLLGTRREFINILKKSLEDGFSSTKNIMGTLDYFGKIINNSKDEILVRFARENLTDFSKKYVDFLLNEPADSLDYLNGIIEGVVNLEDKFREKKLLGLRKGDSVLNFKHQKNKYIQDYIDKIYNIILKIENNETNTQETQNVLNEMLEISKKYGLMENSPEIIELRKILRAQENQRQALYGNKV